jgi:hypothetical protein
VSIVADDPVIRLRTGFLKQAVMRVRGMVADGEIYEATMKAQDLQRYFEWVRETLSPEDRRSLWQQIQALPRNLKTH